jgi:hypothetical protein
MKRAFRAMMPPAGASRTVGPHQAPSIIRYVAMPPPHDEPDARRGVCDVCVVCRVVSFLVVRAEGHAQAREEESTDDNVRLEAEDGRALLLEAAANGRMRHEARHRALHREVDCGQAHEQRGHAEHQPAHVVRRVGGNAARTQRTHTRWSAPKTT